MPVNPYDDRKVFLPLPHGNYDLDIVRASHTHPKEYVTRGITRETVAALTLFTKTLHTSMTLWRHNDVRKFNADAICLEKSSARKGMFQCLSDVYVEIK